MEKRKQQLRNKSMNVAEIHAHALKHMKAKFKYLSEQRQIVIKYIIVKMKKYAGAFFESHATIAKNLNLSVSTVRRAIENAKKLGIFMSEKCFESTLNDKMRQTTNNVILLPFTPAETKIGEVVAVQGEKKETVAPSTVENESEVDAAKQKEEKDLYALFVEYKAKGVSKEVFNRLLEEIRTAGSYVHLIPYMRGALDKVVNHRNMRGMSWDELMQKTYKIFGIS